MTSVRETRPPWSPTPLENGASREPWRRKFDALPLAMYEEDYSGVAAEIERLRTSGVSDLGTLLGSDRAVLDRLIGLIEVKAVNHKAVDLVGAEDEAQLLGTLPPEIFDEETHRSFIDQFVAIWNGESQVSIELEGQQFGGEHIDCLMTWAAPLHDGRPDYANVQIGFLDITARRKAEQTARENAGRLSRLYEVGAAVNSSLDIDEVLELIAEGTANLVEADMALVFLVDHESREITHRFGLGIPDEDIEGNSYDELEEGLSGWVWRHRTGTVAPSIIEDDRNGGKALRRAESDGHWSIAVAPLIGEGGIIGTLTAMRDSSDAPLGDEEYLYVEMLASLASIALTNARLYSGLRDTMDQLGQTQSTLLQAQKLEAVGQLAAGVAHEINTPIQFISDNLSFMRDSIGDVQSVFGAAAALADGARDEPAAGAAVAAFDQAVEDADWEFLNEEIPNAIHQSLDGVQRVAAIVRALKEFSHPGEDSLAPVDVNRAIENTLTVARNEWKYVAEAKTEFDEDLGNVPAVSGPLNQVFLNLLVNAAHAIHDVVGDSGQLGTITLSTRRIEPWVEIRISDTGTGMPDEVKQRIFEPFFTTKEIGKGTGQGLAIAHDVIVNKHRGELDVESEPGAGTTFIIRIPTEAPEPEETP